jgi:formylglycine-generating enzyme required for sulfatase activity/predicted Ser/Thr protein kinase
MRASPPPFPDASGGPPPRLPDRYRVVSLLGRGGMGRVYLCEDTDLEVEVAVKVLPPEFSGSDDAMAAIEKEARLCAKLRGCAGILQLYGFERHEGAALLVMEYAPGGSLHGLVQRRGGLPEDECRRLGAGISEALAHAHERRILHRDLKPANLLLAADGTVRVADFGLARLLADTSSRLSGTGIAGTPVYLPPEVLVHGKVDHRGDLYSLGCTLYEMATARAAFEGTFAEVALQKSARGALPPDPREAKTDLSGEFVALVRSLMERDPLDRPADARRVAAALRGEIRPEAAAPARRETVRSAAPVEPAVRGLPAPSHPPLAGLPLPAGFAEHAGRIWCLKDGAEMAFVAPGAFLRGSDRGAPDEAPARRITLSAYLVDRHEVTVFQYERFAKETGRAMPRQPRSSNDRHPVVGVSHDDAWAYARWAGKCLPTEAQWEKAARGDDGRTYPWGEEAPDETRVPERRPGEEGTSAVGSHPAGRSPYGCFDMVGNGWEWTADWYASDAFAKAEASDPMGPPDGVARVLRGGAWNDPRDPLRVTKRRRARPDAGGDGIGFRCVRDLLFTPGKGATG